MVKVLSVVFMILDLFPSPSNSNQGTKITENLGFEFLLQKVNFFALFLFIIKFSKQNCISFDFIIS